MSNNDQNNRVNDPRHPQYRKDKKESTSQELIPRNGPTWESLPDPSILAKNPDFLAGKKVDFNGLKVSFDAPSGAIFNADSSARPEGQKIEHRRVGDGTFVYNPDKPNEMNIAQISRSSGNTTLKLSYEAKPEQVHNAFSLEMGLLTSAGKHDRIHKVVTLQNDGAVLDNTRKHRHEPYLKAVQKRLRNKGNDNAPEGHDSWAPLEDQCAHCNQYCHKVIDCWGPTDAYGFINACPCNGKHHRSDQCPIVRSWSNLMKYKVFFIYRVGLPQFKHEQSFMHLIVHDPEVRDLHKAVRLGLRMACTKDPSLSWRCNPLTKEFCMKTWNHAKPWAYHSHSNPRDRWCNLPDPTYNDENWLEKASVNMPLNPLKQSFINNKVASSCVANRLPGMRPSWEDLTLAQRTGETHDLVALQENMRAWLNFYNTVHDECITRMECLFRMLANSTEQDLDTMRRCGEEKCTTEFARLFQSVQGVQVSAKPGMGVPQVPQNESDMMTGVYFKPPGEAAALPFTMPFTSTGQITTSSSQNNGQSSTTGVGRQQTNEDEDMLDAESRSAVQAANLSQGVDGFQI